MIANETAERIRQAVQTAGGRRYPAVIVVVPPDADELSLIPRDLAESLTVLDCVTVAQSDPTFRRASCLWRRFLDYLRSTAQETGPLLVRDVDAVVVRWSETDRRRFFESLLTWECRSAGEAASIPVVLPSRLAATVRLPTADHGQALVLDPAEEG